MKSRLPIKTKYHKNLSVIVERGVDGFYVVECPLLHGCYTQGKTVDEALKNIREVIELLMEEKDARDTVRSYAPVEVSLHTLAI
jgi:predicted RNase H-like HicB family nuclease